MRRRRPRLPTPATIADLYGRLEGWRRDRTRDLERSVGFR